MYTTRKMKETTSNCYKTTKDKSELKREREREREREGHFSQFVVWGIWGTNQKVAPRFPP